MNLNILKGHPTWYTAHSPDLENMHGKLYASVDQIVMRDKPETSRTDHNFNLPTDISILDTSIAVASYVKPVWCQSLPLLPSDRQCKISYLIFLFLKHDKKPYLEVPGEVP